MNVASLELCKELYELSGWNDTPLLYCKMWDEGVGYPFDAYPRDFADNWIDDREPSSPAYDLGYLLRKLPFSSTVSGPNEGMFASWLALDSKASFQEADTPEDAAAKLAIELFKQGILTREATS